MAQNVIPDRKSGVEKQRIKCLSFFSGALGLDLGLESAGITPLLACEVDKRCRETITANRPCLGLIGDLCDYAGNEIKAMAGLAPEEDVDLMAGGPPCQAFSTAGKRRAFEDERGNVFLRYIDLIADIRPKFAVIENVRGILSAPFEGAPRQECQTAQFLPGGKKGGALAYILAKLENAGYGVTFNLYNSANFGSPEIRERIVFICSRDGGKAPWLVPTHSENGEYGLPLWRTLRDAIGDLPEEEQIYALFPEKRLRWYRMLKEGQNWRDLPERLQREALGKSYALPVGINGFSAQAFMGETLAYAGDLSRDACHRPGAP